MKLASQFPLPQLALQAMKIIAIANEALQANLDEISSYSLEDDRKNAYITGTDTPTINRMNAAIGSSASTIATNWCASPGSKSKGYDLGTAPTTEIINRVLFYACKFTALQTRINSGVNKANYGTIKFARQSFYAWAGVGDIIPQRGLDDDNACP